MLFEINIVELCWEKMCLLKVKSQRDPVKSLCACRFSQMFWTPFFFKLFISIRFNLFAKIIYFSIYALSELQNQMRAKAESRIEPKMLSKCQIAMNYSTVWTGWSKKDLALTLSSVGIFCKDICIFRILVWAPLKFNFFTIRFICLTGS